MAKSADDAYEALLDAAVAFLADRNIHPAVIGGYDIRQQAGARKYNHELVIHFTGTVFEHADRRESGDDCG